MGGNSRTGIPWSDLPQELVDMISKCLHTETDVLRFRAVCNSWRSSTTPSNKFASTPLRLPFPFTAGEAPHDGSYFNLTERTVYRIELPKSKEPKFWLVKVERLGNGKTRILNPISNHEINNLPGIQMPTVLNTLDFRVSEVCKVYALKYVNPLNSDQTDEYKYAKKVVVSWVVKNDEYVVMAIDRRKKLWYIKSGDVKWSMVPDNGGSNNYLDIVNFKGQLYGVDTGGGTWVFDSMFGVKRIANDIPYVASKRNLVELYNGELHLVEEIWGRDKQVPIINGCRCKFNRVSRILLRIAVVEIKIWALNRQEKKWVETDLLNDRIIFLGDDCSFSVSAKGSSSSRVFYTSKSIFFYTDETKKPRGYEYIEHHCCNYCMDVLKVNYYFVPNGEAKLRFSGLHGHNTGVCDFETGKMGSLIRFPEYADIFWPPPSWLSRA